MQTYLDHVRRIAVLSKPTEKALKALEADWNPDAPPVTIAWAEMAHAIASHVMNIPEDSSAALFNHAEGLLVQGDEDTKAGVATGFLESLLAQSSAGRMDFQLIGPLLGKECREYCRAWDTFCGVRTGGLHESDADGLALSRPRSFIRRVVRRILLLVRMRK